MELGSILIQSHLASVIILDKTLSPVRLAARGILLLPIQKPIFKTSVYLP